MVHGFNKVASNPDVHVMRGVQNKTPNHSKISPDAGFKRKQLTYSNLRMA